MLYVGGKQLNSKQMKIYKVDKRSHQESSQGFTYHSSKAEANKSMAEFKRISGSDFNPDSEIEEIEIEISGKGIIAALNAHGSHNDNG